MMLLENKLISKILQEKNFHIIKKYNISEIDFTEPAIYRFIDKYVRDNKTTPDWRTVVEEFEDFEYIEDVADTFQYLCSALKKQTAKRLQFNLFQNELPKKFQELDGIALQNWISEELNKIKILTEFNTKQGSNFATNGEERLEWYLKAKENKDRTFIPTPYPTLTNKLGGWELGDYVLINAFTNRGKSWLASHIGLVAWKNNFGVLHYSPELSKKQQLQRLDTLNGHFNNVALKFGNLDNEEQYKEYLQQFNEENSTPYIVKTMEDLPFGLTIKQIENDLSTMENINMVIIDGFNLMQHKGNDSSRNNMANTSRHLRQLFAKYNIVGIVVHQTPQSAEKENAQKDEIGRRIVKPPELHQYSETIAVIQDACTVLSFDQHDGIGKLKVVKARQPVIGLEIELTCNFNYGYIEERPETFDF